MFYYGLSASPPFDECVFLAGGTQNTCCLCASLIDVLAKLHNIAFLVARTGSGVTPMLQKSASSAYGQVVSECGSGARCRTGWVFRACVCEFLSDILGIPRVGTCMNITTSADACVGFCA